MLGLVLTPYGTVPGTYPWEINKTQGGSGPFLRPYDPWYYQRGETGFYYDTYLGRSPLGAIPTDAELGPNMCYTPVESAWVASNQGYLPPPWNPPNGWSAGGAYGPATSLRGGRLGDIESELVEHHRKMWTLSALSTFASVAGSAIIFYRTIKLLQDDNKARAKASAKESG